VGTSPRNRYWHDDGVKNIKWPQLLVWLVFSFAFITHALPPYFFEAPNTLVLPVGLLLLLLRVIVWVGSSSDRGSRARGWLRVRGLPFLCKLDGFLRSFKEGDDPHFHSLLMIEGIYYDESTHRN